MSDIDEIIIPERCPRCNAELLGAKVYYSQLTGIMCEHCPSESSPSPDSLRALSEPTKEELEIADGCLAWELERFTDGGRRHIAEALHFYAAEVESKYAPLVAAAEDYKKRVCEKECAYGFDNQGCNPANCPAYRIIQKLNALAALLAEGEK